MSKPYRLSWREMQDFRHDQLSTTLALTQRLGRVAHVNMLGTNLYLISEPDVIRDLLIKHPRQLHRDPFTRRVLGRIIGEGLFIAEDEPWQRQRKVMQPMFHAAHIHDFATVFAEHTRQMCVRWQAGAEVQLDQEMMALALRIICQTMFSADISALTDRLGLLMQTIMNEAEAQLRLGLPLPAWLPTPGNLRQKGALAELHSLLLGIIHDRQARLARNEAVSNDLLTMLLSARDEAGQPLSDLEVLDECMTIFIAGHETTAVSLTWTWYLLLQNPAILARLQAEIDNVLGAAPITYDAVAKLPYLTQVVKESLRYYPPAPGFGRTPTTAFSVNGHTFQPGDILMITTYVLHRQAEFYPNPEEFCPERFAATTEGGPAQPPRYAYLPFGAGARTCIGNAFATLEMQMALATMVQSVKLALVPGQEVVPEMLVTLRPRNGVRVRVVEKCGEQRLLRKPIECPTDR